jgi:hypothetical protein
MRKQALWPGNRMLPVMLFLLMNFGLSNAVSASAVVPDYSNALLQEGKVYGKVTDKKTGEPII